MYQILLLHDDGRCVARNMLSFIQTGNNKILYIVASCCIFLYELYYDAQIHARQVYFPFMKPKFHCRPQNSRSYPGAAKTVQKFSPISFMYRTKQLDSNLKSNINP